MITLLVPTRKRPEMCKRMIESARSTAAGELEIILGIGGDADNAIFRDTYYGYDIKMANKTIYCGEMPVVYVLNDILQYAHGDLIMVVGDDCVFATDDWDKALLDHYNELYNKIHVYSLQDSRDKDGTPHPIATKEYVRAMGYLYTPIFHHFYPDTWMIEIAKYNGCFTHIRDYTLIHDKPSDRGIFDDTHNHVRQHGWLNRDKQVNQMCQHFLEVEKQRLGTHMRIANNLYKAAIGTVEHVD